MEQVIILKTANGFSVEAPDIHVDIKPGVYVFLSLPSMLAFLAQLYEEVPNGD